MIVKSFWNADTFTLWSMEELLTLSQATMMQVSVDQILSVYGNVKHRCNIEILSCMDELRQMIDLIFPSLFSCPYDYISSRLYLLPVSCLSWNDGILVTASWDSTVKVRHITWF